MLCRLSPNRFLRTDHVTSVTFETGGDGELTARVTTVGTAPSALASGGHRDFDFTLQGAEAEALRAALDAEAPARSGRGKAVA